MTIQDTIKQLDELREKATQGEWELTEIDPTDDCTEVYCRFARVGAVLVEGGRYGFDEEDHQANADARFIASFIAAYEDLRRAALAGAELAEAVREIRADARCEYECRGDIKEQRDAALAAYHKACGDGKL